MKRRLIKQQTACTVTLPIDWLRAQKLDAKDEVDIVIENDTVVIRTAKKNTLLEISITAESGTFDYYRILIENHYLKGFDRIHLTMKEPKELATVDKIVRNLIGFEIISQTTDTKKNTATCVIAATTLASAEQFQTLLRRCLHITSHTIELLQRDLHNGKITADKEVAILTDDARRFLLYCTRTLHKTSIVTRDNESFMHLLLERLILIQHNLNYLTQKNKAKSFKLRKPVLDLFTRATSMFGLFEEMLLKKDLTNFSKVNKLWREIYFETGQKLFVGCNLAESVIIYHSMHMSKLIFLISQPSLVLQKIE